MWGSGRGNGAHFGYDESALVRTLKPTGFSNFAALV